jgi:hypothetical protein
MKSEASLIVLAITAVLTLLNLTLMPEDLEAIQTLVQLFVLAGGFGAVRQFVASRRTVEKLVGREQAAAEFNGNAV